MKTKLYMLYFSFKLIHKQSDIGLVEIILGYFWVGI